MPVKSMNFLQMPVKGSRLDRVLAGCAYDYLVPFVVVKKLMWLYVDV
jgi:hypothetical protein